jgi:hypothetical protein
MGVGLSGLQFLEFARKSGIDFSGALTLGRQAMHLSRPSARRFYERIGAPDSAARITDALPWMYCEELLKQLYHAGTVDSVDASAYEHATLVHDMNFALAPQKQYSFVMDMGCLEHIFNVPQALANVIALTRKGGHIGHFVPANNYNGHGFYQFSPELFFSLYCEERGFEGTRVFLTEVADPSHWYEVTSPKELKSRVNVVNFSDLDVIVFTRKRDDGPSVFTSPPMQSDYVTAWGDQAAGGDARSGLRRHFKGALDRFGIVDYIRAKKNSFPFHLLWPATRLSARRKDLRRFDIYKELKRR